jgi:hypothetical protein
MRGEVWCLTRSQEGRKPGPATGVFCERHGEEILPPAFDMLPVLLRFYHATSLVLGVSNPLPAKLVLPATAGPAPKLPAGLVPEQTERATPEQLAEFREQLRSAMGGRRPAKHENNGHAESNGHASK